MRLDRRVGSEPTRGFGRRIGIAGLCTLGVLAVASPAAAQGPMLGPELLRQMAALQAEKEQRSAPQRKLDSQLIFAMKRRSGDPMLAAVPEMRVEIEQRGDGAAHVDLEGRITPELEQAVRQLGGSIESSHSQWGSLRAWLPMQSLEPLATRSDVRWIRPAMQHATEQQGMIVSQGDGAHLANAARGVFGVDGSGVKICALSDGVDTLAESQASGELPAVDVLPGRAGMGREGAALLEIIHDLAPGAALGYATALGGMPTFATAIQALRFQAGCEVIVDDIAYPDAPAFQDGPIAQAVSTVVSSGAVYVSSAGNSGGLNRGTGVWEGDFRGTRVTAADGSSLLANDFGGGWLSNRIDVDASSYLLQWADPFGGSSNDYDLFMVDPTVTRMLGASTSTQTGTQPPFEAIVSSASDRGNLLIVMRKSGADRFLRLHAFPSGTLAMGSQGAIFGHKGSPAVITVAAAAAGSDPNVPFPSRTVEPFSSDGPRRIFFRADGSPITPGNFSSSGGITFAKPDLVGADGVVTSTRGFELFRGTSAAAPHIAAIAGLVIAAGSPNGTPLAGLNLRLGMRQILQTSATPLDGGPFDVGAGAVNAFIAVQASNAGVPCGDGVDNDGDGRIDLSQDPGCAGLGSISESPDCDDRLDNDSDGIADTLDSDCTAPSDPTECGTGAAQTLAVVPLLAYLGRRKRRKAREART
jgi:hypothetical protein